MNPSSEAGRGGIAVLQLAGFRSNFYSLFVYSGSEADVALPMSVEVALKDTVTIGGLSIKPAISSVRLQIW